MTPPSSGRAAGDRGDGGRDDGAATLVLAGDVMLGRGIDQVLGRSVDPGLHERHVRSARRYVELAREASGPIPEPVDPSYPWGDALEAMERADPDARVVNLETAVTTSERPWTGKGIHYRTHPANARCLAVAGVDVCALANNHVLDWGRPGLAETLDALHGAGVRTAGAGRDLEEARAPAEVESDGGRVVVFAFGSPTGGIPRSWAAGGDRAGVSLLPELSEAAARETARRIRAVRRQGDRVVASLHWGGNWGYRVPERQRRFARRLVEEGGVDVVHGHSSHHPKGIGFHRGRPILYGCGDLINDYEGISGHGEYRPRLALVWVVRLPGRDPPSAATVEAIPFRIRRFRLERASDEDARWLRETLDRESRELGARVELGREGRLRVRPAAGGPGGRG